MHYIVLSEKDYRENPTEILTHEMAHIRHHHSWDLLLADIGILLQWFNPAAWLLKQEMQSVHEYEADDAVLAAGIDAAAHEGALEATTPSGTVGRTIAVMGTPLSQPWPPANARLAHRIAQHGLLLSLAPQVSGLSFTDEERAESLRARNRAIAAIGLGSLVMAGKEGSSTLREIGHSLELGRPVLIWHSIVEAGEPWALRLLEEAPRDETGRALVQTVSSAEDVEEALSPWSTVWWL